MCQSCLITIYLLWLYSLWLYSLWLHLPGVCQSCFITMRSTNCDGGKWFFMAALVVLLLLPAGFLIWAVWFVVRQVYYRKVIT